MGELPRAHKQLRWAVTLLSCWAISGTFNVMIQPKSTSIGFQNISRTRLRAPVDARFARKQSSSDQFATQGGEIGVMLTNDRVHFFLRIAVTEFETVYQPTQNHFALLTTGWYFLQSLTFKEVTQNLPLPNI